MSLTVAPGRAASIPASIPERTASSISSWSADGSPTTAERHMSPW
jgi:hypothetical protein